MKLRISVHGRYLTLLAALGLPVATPLACNQVEFGTAEHPCTDSTEEVVLGHDSGYEMCAEGQRHRARAATCASDLPRADVTCTSEPDFPGTCTTDEDCTDKPHGRCGMFGQVPTCECTYGCVTDADCSDGQICDCGDPVGRCVRADCSTDDDCEGGRLCVAYESDPGCGFTAFTCQTDEDQCASDADCEDDKTCTKIGERLECQFAGCAIGRPFLVAGAHRTAASTTRHDWVLSASTPTVEGISDTMRKTLEAHWREVGLMEHASIAAFARFALQLLAVGAPPELLIETQSAMRDETEHAQLAFALATTYAGRDIGPGPLAIDGALDDDDPHEMLRMVIVEGCIGETVAALEAAEAAEHATDPVVRDVLLKIARDEQRHAELAWRFVAWAVGEDAAFAHTLMRELGALESERVTGGELTQRDHAMLAHGVVTAGVRDRIRHAALSEMILPTARALVSQRMAA